MNVRHQIRPAWTYNNVGAFNYWMKTGASELPADWIEDSDVDRPPSMHGEREIGGDRSTATN